MSMSVTIDGKERKPGEVFTVGNRMYSYCSDCEKIVCLNKRFLGSWHLCLTDEERALKRQNER